MFIHAHTPLSTPHARSYSILALTLIILCFLTSPASAHPHAWIDTKIKVLFSSTGKITGLQENWLLDEGYTAFVLQRLTKKNLSALTAQDFKKIAEKITKNLKPYDYFTKAMDGKTAAKIASLEAINANMLGRRFNLNFTLKFQAPLKSKDISYKIYDPTYYVEMLHAEDKDAIQLTKAPAGCAYKIIKPNPPIEAVIKAANLGMASPSNNQLGKVFAEKVDVSCR